MSNAVNRFQLNQRNAAAGLIVDYANREELVGHTHYRREEHQKQSATDSWIHDLSLPGAGFRVCRSASCVSPRWPTRSGPVALRESAGVAGARCSCRAAVCWLVQLSARFALRCLDRLPGF